MAEKNQTLKSSETGDAQNSSSGGGQAGISFSDWNNSSHPAPPMPATYSSGGFYFNPPPPPFNTYNIDPTVPPLLNFNDDEPLQVPPVTTTTFPNSSLEKIAIKTFTEFPAVAASDSFSSFAVLLGIHAPPLPVVVADHVENQRVPIDLVAVLDVSGSMRGKKLSLMKSATNFVIDHMLPCDRLSIISFSTSARRILPLRRMTERGRQDAKISVDLLRADASTNIVAGLNMGAQVLEQRRESNPVSSIIFVSDGHDTHNRRHLYSNLPARNASQDPPGYLQLLSSSIFSGNIETDEIRRQRFPVHTFGVGMRHDAVALNAIADGSRGTYSFVESAEMIPRSFARCIGGLFSVVAQDVRVVVWSGSPGVEIKSIPSGRHPNEIISQQKQGIIHVGDLYAEEKKDFLVYLSIPTHLDNQMVTGDETIGKTPLLDIVCYYRNALTDEIVQIDDKSIEILRPINLSPGDKLVNLMVDRQRNRVAVAESIAKAKEMADRGNLTGAKEVLTHSRETLLASTAAQSGDDMVKWLEAELKEVTSRMANMDLYDCQGRAFMLAGMSAHAAQRATSRNHTFLEAACYGEAASSRRAAPFGASGAAAFGASGGASFGASGGASFGGASGGAAFGARGAALGDLDVYGCAAAGKACEAAYDTPMMLQMQNMVQKP